ncbi:MAG: sulfur oxidation c-type cytochrome SoxA [Burkholderiaceae bacterium]
MIQWAGRTVATFLAALALPVFSQTPPNTPRSSFLDMSPENQALQRHPEQSPALLERMNGERTWAAQCLACHGELSSMGPIVRRFPRLHKGHVQRLSDQINDCRVTRLRKSAIGVHDPEMLSLSLVLQQSANGLAWTPVSPADGPAASAHLAQGQRLFEARLGQLNLSCAQCHNDLAGQRLGGAVIPQGHPNGYPIYRLEWQAVGSLERRIRNCNIGVRAEPLDPASQEMRALVAYLAHRARGMPLEGMAVRP